MVVEKKALMVNVTKLKTIRNYALTVGKTVAWIYRLGERGDLNIIEIDGVKFVKLD